MFGVTAGHDEDDNRVIKSAVQWDIWPKTGNVGTMVQCHEGQEICTLCGTRDELRDRTAKVARQMLRANGMNQDHVRGAFSVMCALNHLVGGEGAMELLGEKLGEALGWAPTLGIVAGGEYGPITGKGCEAGGAMYSCAVWSASDQQTKLRRPSGSGSVLLDTRGGQLQANQNTSR